MIDFQKVRYLAQETLKDSQDMLTINYSLIDRTLVPKLNSFSLNSKPKQIFVKNEKDEDWELGLNIFFNVINFCFKDPTTGKEYKYCNKNGKMIKRSTGLFTSLAEYNVDWGVFHKVADLEKNKWIETIQLSKSNPLYLGEDRFYRVTKLAEFFLATKNIAPTMLLENSHYQADILAEILFKSGLFKDDFLKRVQVAVHAIDNVLRRRHNTGLKNIEMLTCKADYRIPQVLYNLNIIQLSDELKNKLIKDQIIEPDSREEIALRSCVIMVGNIVAQKMNITEVDADLLLWNLSQDMSVKEELSIPHMLVATDKY
jgi:hypothetical protein